MKKFENILNYTFKDKTLLREAVTHRSFTTEHNLDYDNQRFEFLGDAVIEIILTDYLFKKFNKEGEGFLTQLRATLVQEEALATLARAISLGDFLLLGKGEILSGGDNRDSILSDAFEALLGSIYLDSNLDTTKDFLIDLINKTYLNLRGMLKSSNPKGELQEYSQKQFNVTPEYKVVNVTGPEHNHQFTIKASVRDIAHGVGTATRKKTAESLAAKNILETLRKL